MSKSHKGGFTHKKDLTFPSDFFAALEVGDEHEALACLRAEALPDGEQATPRAQALIDSGEWDSAQNLALVRVDANFCRGRIGKDDYRFCGKPFCVISAHNKTKVDNIKSGWYISFGKAQGLLTTPFLPVREDGGPITTVIATKLMAGENSFKMTRGQWKFLIDSWHASQVDSVSLSDKSEKSNASSVVIEFERQPSSESGPQSLRVEVEDPEPFQQGAMAEAFSLAIVSLGDNEQHLSKIFQMLKEQSDVAMRETLYLRGTVSQMNQEAQQNRAALLRLEEKAQQHESRAQLLDRNFRALQTKYDDDMRGYTVHARALRERVETLEAMGENFARTGGQLPPGDNQLPPGLVDKVEELDVAMFGATGSFTRFKTSFLEFKERLESGGGIECNGVAFKSQGDFLKWFEKEEPTVDIFLDAIAFMHGISSPVVHSADAIKQMELQMKTDISTGLEATVLSSFATVLPSILVGGGGKRTDSVTMGGTFAWLSGYLKKFEVWKPVGSVNGVSHQISSGVESVSRRVVELRKRFVDNKVLLLSAGLCADSATFCKELVAFINDQQEELITNTPYTAEQVWQMQLECLQKIIVELSEARLCYSEAGWDNRGNFVWGMLMSWKIQQRYRANHFKDDPALTGILVRRILMQGQDNSVKKQLQKVDANEAKIDNYKRDNNAAVKAVKDEVNKLKEEVVKMKK